MKHLWWHVWDALWKTTFFYFLLILLLRVTGKREIGTLSSIDLVGFIIDISQDDGDRCEYAVTGHRK